MRHSAILLPGLALGALTACFDFDGLSPEFCGNPLLGIPCPGEPCGDPTKPASCPTPATESLQDQWYAATVLTEDSYDVGCGGVELDGLQLVVTPITIVQTGNDLVVDGTPGALLCEGFVYLDDGFLGSPVPGPFEGWLADPSGVDPPEHYDDITAGCGGPVVEIVDANTLRQTVTMDFDGCTAFVQCTYTRTPPAPSTAGGEPEERTLVSLERCAGFGAGTDLLVATWEVGDEVVVELLDAAHLELGAR